MNCVFSIGRSKGWCCTPPPPFQLTHFSKRSRVGPLHSTVVLCSVRRLWNPFQLGITRFHLWFIMFAVHLFLSPCKRMCIYVRTCIYELETRDSGVSCHSSFPLDPRKRSVLVTWVHHGGPFPVVDPGFPVVGGGGVDSRGGYISKILYIKMKESGPSGGVRQSRPLDPPMLLRDPSSFYLIVCLFYQMDSGWRHKHIC